MHSANLALRFLLVLLPCCIASHTNHGTGGKANVVQCACADYGYHVIIIAFKISLTPY